MSSASRRFRIAFESGNAFKFKVGAWGSSVFAHAPEDSGPQALCHHGYILPPGTVTVESDANFHCRAWNKEVIARAILIESPLLRQKSAVALRQSANEVEKTTVAPPRFTCDQRT